MLKTLELKKALSYGRDVRRFILLIESKESQHLCLKTLRRQSIDNEIVVPHNFADGLDYMRGLGRWTGRNGNVLPSFILVDSTYEPEAAKEFVAEVRKDAHTKHMPIVLLSSAKEDELHALYEAGVTSVVEKPSDATEFEDMLLTLTLYWLLLHSSPFIL